MLSRPVGHGDRQHSILLHTFFEEVYRRAFWRMVEIPTG